ncbi:MAG: ExbD/TolR family protein [bacterium]
MSAEPTWDVFESESLTVRRGLNAHAIRQSLAQNQLSEDDLIRPAGSSEPWQRLGDTVANWPGNAASAPASISNPSQPRQLSDNDLLNPDIEIDIDDSSPGLEVPASPVSQQVESAKPTRADAESMALSWLMSSDEDEVATPEPVIEPAKPAEQRARSATAEHKPEKSPVKPDKIEASEPKQNLVQEPVTREKWLEPSVELDQADPTANELGHFAGDDEEEEEEFTLARSATQKVEELDLAAMVDVAFQLVLFFMVTASVTLIKTMDLPKPTESTKPAASSAPSVGTKSKNEVETEFIVVSINAAGEISIDDEPITTDQIVERLREVRTQSGKTGMLLRAENKTRHRTAVLAYDAANEIGLRIAIEREASE